MSTYKGNAGHLMQHWTLCELLDIAGKKDTPGLNFIDAHAMAPLARVREEANMRFDIVQARVQAGLPKPNLAYEYAWQHLDPNEGYPNSAAFVKQVWEGDFSMLLCEIDDATNEGLKPWLANIGTLERCKRAKLFPDDWLKRFCKPLPSPCDVGLPDGSLTLVSFDPDRYDMRRLDTRHPRRLYPGNLELTLRALDSAKGGVLIQLSTYSRGHNNDTPQGAAISSVNSILTEVGFTLAAVVWLNGDMMSLVYSCNVSWSAELADLPVRFNEWLNGN